MRDWGKIKLGALCEVITKGTTPTSIGHKFKQSGIKFIKIESLSESGEIIPNKVAYIDDSCHQALKRSQLKKDDILFSIAGALGRVGIVKEDILPANTNQALAIIRLRKDSNVLVEFIAKYFNSNIVTDEIEKLRIGAAQQNLSLAQLNNLVVPLPPLPEQKRIVAILDEAFAAIATAKAHAEQNLRNARELFESHLQGVFERNGKGWEEGKVKEVGNAQTGTTPKTAEKENYGNFIPFVKPADVDFSGIGDIRYSNEGLSEIGLKRGRKMESGSILMVCIGATIGKVGFAEREVSCNQQINSLTVKNAFEPKFIYYAMASKEFQDKVLLEGKGAQATLPIINKSKWENLTVLFPKSKTEQQAIVRQLDALRAETQKLEAVYRKKLEDLEELKKSILQQAFAGELTT